MMREEGIQIDRFKVRKLMREMKPISKQPGSHTYKKATVQRPDIPNVLERAFDVTAPNQVWCGDIKYVWAQGQWHYVAAVIDLFARRRVGWAFSPNRTASWSSRRWTWRTSTEGGRRTYCFTVIRAQYGSRAFRQRLWRYGFKQSMSRRSKCLDNAPMKRLFRSLKAEWVPSVGYMSAAQAQQDFGRFMMQRCNWERPHQFNGELLPAITE